MKIYYHATNYDNLLSIMDNGIQANNIEKIVYLTEKEEDAIKFVAFRGYSKIVTFKVKVYKKDEKNIIETFDHNYSIFKCRSFGHIGDISPSSIEPSKVYDMSNIFK